MVNQFYTAKNDIVFKAVMVRNERVLRRLLEVILEIGIDEIILLDKEILPSRLMGKNRIVDLLVKSGNKMINVELNASKKYYHNYRNASYLFGIYNDAIDRSEEYETLAEKEFIKKEDLIGKPLILPERMNVQSELVNWFGKDFSELQIAFTSNLGTNAGVMAANGLGYPISIEGAAKYWREDILVQRKISPEITTSTVIAWRRNIPYSLAVSKMIEEINAFQA